MIWLEAKPFTWTADPDKIIAAIKRGHQRLAGGKVSTSIAFSEGAN